MKAFGFLLVLLVFNSVLARKPLTPLDKNVNLAFINMEAGGAQQPKPGVIPSTSPNQNKPGTPTLNTSTDKKPSSNSKLGVPEIKPPVSTSAPVPVSSPKTPSSPPIVGVPTAKPASGSVQQLVNLYDSRGQHSVIRPYSYADAVKKNRPNPKPQTK